MDNQAQGGWPPVIATKVQSLTYTQVIYLVKDMDRDGASMTLRSMMGDLANMHPSWLYPPQSVLEKAIRDRAKKLLEEAPALLHRALTDFEETNRGRPITRPHWSENARHLLLAGV